MNKDYILTVILNVAMLVVVAATVLGLVFGVDYQVRPSVVVPSTKDSGNPTKVS